MRVHSAEALILRTYRYGEADRIVVFLTEDRGKKRGVAKNASKSRRRFGGALDPLTSGRVTYVEREGRELVRLDRIEASQTPLRAADGRPNGDAASVLGHTGYFAELIDEWSPDGAANERLFRLGVAVGDALCHGGAIDVLARYFEYWLMRLEGVYPALDVCPHCGRPSLGEGAVLIASERAYVCDTCAPAGPHLSSAAVALLRGAGSRTPRDVGASAPPASILREIEQVHHVLITWHLEKELRSARVVRELRPA